MHAPSACNAARFGRRAPRPPTACIELRILRAALPDAATPSTQRCAPMVPACCAKMSAIVPVFPSVRSRSLRHVIQAAPERLHTSGARAPEQRPSSAEAALGRRASGARAEWCASRSRERRTSHSHKRRASRSHEQLASHTQRSGIRPAPDRNDHDNGDMRDTQATSRWRHARSTRVAHLREAQAFGTR